MFFDLLVVFDQIKRCITAVVYADTTSSKESSIEELYLNSISKIQKTRNLMRVPLKENDFLDWNENENLNLDLKSNWKKKDFEDAVLSAKEYIRKGDIFQIVISQRFQTQVNNDPFSLYRSLRMVNPSPYMSFFDFGSWYLIGSSPEVMVKAKINKNSEIVASLRPIAGTRPRGIDNQQDLELEKDLLKDPKEIAEHVMLIDLGRNDLGRVCEIGTVEVKDLMVIEKYSHVMHIVSNVEGSFNNKFTKFDTLLSGFPAGTVSGAPKIRAMEIIDELENTRRKVYAGGIGYFSANGDFDTCIALRTAISKNNKFYIQSGAGIVADSKPLNEFNETVNKAKALIKALE